VILGKIYFLLVRIKIKFMELAVIRREAAGALSNLLRFLMFCLSLTLSSLDLCVMLPNINTFRLSRQIHGLFC
jgi:hypothetical protein